ncbi:protein-L-isoaspartate(D-aspartate) O-methyltransferase [Polymorphum gilvum]|uniref:Protein-L-isoaspartate O-methyltransferase n=1 Tax=Polymorphum gilvum (strain LMG 25793 / CGMCC 1.9160 / SL003B-26A1) TaxID=991905 RepID=F2IZ10_POLGS|nr:protein-L-isoaspartate(D-aspartate) O-methyltransferase [Polymorphum gilvum]ADZ70625.1 L-isoaspartyl protein carboxyl methyltransferase protein [Polymorphum gilvum SL003B-26A1]
MADGDSDTIPTVSRDEIEARAALVLGLRRRGISDRRVLSAIERVPRRLFLAAAHHKLAYEDSLLPIECGQVVSAPSLVAAMVEALDVQPDSTVLEVGTGSGYQTAVLTHLARQVYSVDRYASLVTLARQRLAALRIGNAEIQHADGLLGLKERAPFDRIIVTGAVAEVPEALRAQLAPGGRIVLPLGPAGAPQALVRLLRDETGERRETLCEVRLVSLRSGIALHL